MNKAKAALQKPRGRRVEFTGTVVGDVKSSTIKIEVFRMVRHGRYGKILRKSSTLYAHDEKQVAKSGDKVRVVSTRPMSKLKRWKLLEVLKA